MRTLRAAALVLGCVLALGSNPAFGNLIVNGDFESGGVGFGTQYQVAFSNVGQPGQMTVTSAPSTWNTSFANPPASGMVLVASGSTSMHDAVWMSTIPVTQGATYQISFNAASLSTASPANLRFYVRAGSA